MTSPSPWALAVDIGTSSARALIFDARGRHVEGLRSQVGYTMRTDASGASECGADELVEHVARCIDDVLALAGARSGRIAAVGVCTFWHSTVGIDRHGQAVTPLLTWADTRSAAAARDLARRLDARAIHSRTGCALHPSYLPARLVWLRQAQPGLFAGAARWVSPGEYLFLRLFGDSRCSISIASGTGLFDQNRCDWDDEMLDAAGISRASVADLTDIDEPARGLSGDWAARWPVLAALPWVPAIGDGAASNLGSGCASDRRMAINLGTSGAVRVLWEARHVAIPDALWCYRLDRRRPLLGGAFSDGGDAYAWARRAFAVPDEESLAREAARQAPGAHGLVTLPFLSGERSVGWRPDASAILSGITLATRPADVALAVMEGVALRFALVAGVLDRQFGGVAEVLASGGALAASPTWARMLAEAVGRPITVLGLGEATSRGAALVALRAAGALEDESEAETPAGRAVVPDPGRMAAMRDLLTRQQALYEATSGA